MGAAMFEGNQFMFLVLIALVISGALRVALELRGASPPHAQATGGTAQSLPCDTTRASLAAAAGAGSIAAGAAGGGERGGAQAGSLLPANRDPSSPFFGLAPWTLPPSLTEGAFAAGSPVDPNRFRFHVKVLAFDRIDSILRSLRSLESADYGTDTVSLDIFIDHTFGGDPTKWTPQAAKRVAASHALLLKLDSFQWSHGEKRVTYRSVNGGIQPQWLEAWWPESLNDFVLIVEDDMELSPLYYQYFKRLLAHYYYNATNFEPHTYGISFQRQTFVAGIGGSPVHPAPHPFLYQLVGTWGQFLFPLPWRSFRMWYDMRRHNASREPVLEGLKTTQWWHNKGNKLWTPWVIKWAHAESMFTLYPAFPSNLSLSISHRDKGSNFAKNRGADSSLLSAIPLEPKDPVRRWWAAAFPALQQTPRRDLCFHLVSYCPPARQLDELNLLLEAMKLEIKRLALVIIPQGAYDLGRNWVCHAEATGLRNYVLVVSCPRQAATLANMGHLVYLTSKNGTPSVGPGVGGARSGQGKAGAQNQWTSEHVRLVLATLSFGFDTLVTAPENVWVGNPLGVDLGESFDMWGRLDPVKLSDSLLYVHSSETTIAAWSRLRAAWVKAEAAGQSTVLLQQAAQGWLMGRDITFQTVEGTPLEQAREQTPAEAGRLAIAMGPRRDSKEEKVADLQRAGLWVVDDYDFACKSVVCRRKAPP